MTNRYRWDASLQSFKVISSSTPAAFLSKMSRVPEDARADIVVVFVDVLRVTSTMLAVAAVGCRGIYLSPKSDSPDGTFFFVRPEGAPDDFEWVYGGELMGKPIVGVASDGSSAEGVIANSPLEASRELFEAKYLRLFSANGALALSSITSFGVNDVYAMATANVDVTVSRVIELRPSRIWFVCGGFYGSAATEDNIVAGLAIDQLMHRGAVSSQDLDDEAWQMWMSARAVLNGHILDSSRFVEILSQGQVARLLVNIGHADDLLACSTGAGLSQEVRKAMGSTMLYVENLGVPMVVPKLG